MGIAMGWGCGNPTESYARGNAITYNRVDRANQRLADGGSVYTLSAQPGSTIAYNYVSNQRLRDSPLYHDGGSAGFHDHHNVYDHLGCTRPAGEPDWWYSCQWVSEAMLSGFVSATVAAQSC